MLPPLCLPPFHRNTRFKTGAQQSFEPSKHRPDQTVRNRAECQRRRRADYHRSKLATDPEYAQVVRDSQKKWRDAHPGYQQQYREKHPAARGPAQSS